ncbi:hypothetical protein KJ359_012775 [Pestalotiopsis sp. 9143b]|nr:hypothetical protein KJ359_012775 [Pestalotiopsis sp. 9143b]
MNAVDRKLEQCTAIPEALSDSNLAQFRSKVREILPRSTTSLSTTGHPTSATITAPMPEESFSK